MVQNVTPVVAVQPQLDNLTTNIQNVENVSKPHSTLATSATNDIAYSNVAQKQVSVPQVVTLNPESNSTHNSVEFPSEKSTPVAVPCAPLNVPNVPADGVFAGMMLQQNPLPSSTENTTTTDSKDSEGDNLEFPPDAVDTPSMVTSLSNPQGANHFDASQKSCEILTVPMISKQEDDPAVSQNTAGVLLDISLKSSNILPTTSIAPAAPTTTTTTTHLNIPTLTEIEPDGSHQNN